MIIGDVETTGTDPWSNEIITGHFLATDDQLRIIDEIGIKCRPEFPTWDEEAESKHKITRAEAMSFPNKLESMKSLLNFLAKHGRQSFVCHALFMFNSHFDYAFLWATYCHLGLEYEFFKYLRSQDVLSTITLTRKKFTFADYKLATICKNFSITLNHHDAKSDTYACYEILRRVYGTDAGTSSISTSSNLRDQEVLPISQTEIQIGFKL